jgi:hypothetical protein
MPYSEPIKPGDTMDTLRKVARLAHLIIDLKVEYEKKPRPVTLEQIVQRSAELHELCTELVPPALSEASPEAKNEPQAQG